MSEEFIVYTVKLTRFLQANGFQFIRVIPDVTKKDFKNWVFQDTPELRAKVSEYLKK